MSHMTIRSVTPGEKVGKIIFEEDATRTIKYWASAAFASMLKAGETGEAKFETVKSKNPEYPDDTFLKSWNGVEGKAATGGGTRAGAKYERDDASIVAQVCLKGAFECAIHNASHGDAKPKPVDPNEVRALALDFARCYKDVYGAVKAGNAQ